jgi:hypothetical protein
MQVVVFDIQTNEKVFNEEEYDLLLENICFAA